ncbi:hypothetical protein GEMRC1_004752 [Eukaryota sp. GEM-RC1]
MSVLIGSFTEHTIECTTYQHSSGASIVFCSLPHSPICQLSVGFKTLCSSDHGLPHCLEHMCFLGSENHPSKGLLDRVATLHCSTGTNAFTYIDQTVYTLQTAGPDGIIKVLPIYLDHLFRPTITPESLLTEIHHINSAGEDGGVVFSEVSADFYSDHSQVYHELLKHLYSDSPYQYNYGGSPLLLHELSLSDLLTFHSTFYSPSNSVIVVTGSFNDEFKSSFLGNLNDFLEELNPGQSDHVSIPAIPPLSASVSTEIFFPSEDEDVGIVQLGWRLCDYNDWTLISAFKVLSDYLAEGSSAPFVKELIECENPICSEVEINLIEVKSVAVVIEFEDVDVDFIDDVADRVDALIEQVISDGIDMERIAQLIKRHDRRLLFDFDCGNIEEVSEEVISSFLYSNGLSLDSLKDSMNRSYGWLLEKDDQFWIQCLQVFLNQPKVEVKGFPSAEKGKRSLNNQI